jgi:hypothetical protein
MTDFSLQDENPADEYVLAPLVNTIRKVQIIVILVALASSYLFVFIKLKFKIDITGSLSLLLYLVAMLIRAVDYFFNPNSGVIDLIQLESQILVWYSLYYFALEMLRIKHMIEAASPSEYSMKAMRHRIF